MLQVDGLTDEQRDCVEFSQICMERDFHAACSSLNNVRYEFNRYIKHNADALPLCVESYDNGTYTADDLRDIVVGCYEDFKYILKLLDKACARNDETSSDFYASMLKL